MTEFPHQAMSPSLENHSDHFPDSDTRLAGSAMQVRSASVPGAGWETVEDLLK
ncbi:MAG: hypothetical protein PHV74_00065 [Dehalococcoidia bacterium]|nr:hypothetical protein [Dehalococcoidia bacterium]